MSFLSCLFDKTKKHLIDIFSFCQKDNLKKISFCYLLNIFSLCRKDNLKKITFNYLLVFCAVWVIIYNYMRDAGSICKYLFATSLRVFLKVVCFNDTSDTSVHE